MPTESKTAAKLRLRLGGIETKAMRGDNLAVTFATEFERLIDDDDAELDDSGTWKQQAIDQTNEVLDAIHAHYTPTLEANAREIERLEKERDAYKAVLFKTDPQEEKDSVRLHREKMEQRARAEAAEARVAALEAERDKLREGLRPFLPISIHNTQDYAEVSFGNHQTQAMTVQPDDWRRLNDLFTAASGAEQGGEDGNG